jgi:hypothetical protein
LLNDFKIIESGLLVFFKLNKKIPIQSWNLIP